MRAYKSASNKKIEMVPLIDVIFLLLIFFLVTLNIIPVRTRNDIVEAQFAMPVVTSTDPARVDMLVQLHQYRNETDVHFFTVDGQMDNVFAAPGALQNIAALSQKTDPASKRQLRRIFRDHYFSDADRINFDGVEKVIISANPSVQYEQLFRVIERCEDRGITYYFSVGSFEEFQQKIHFSLPREIVRRYEQ